MENKNILLWVGEPRGALSEVYNCQYYHVVEPPTDTKRIEGLKNILSEAAFYFDHILIHFDDFYSSFLSYMVDNGMTTNKFEIRIHDVEPGLADLFYSYRNKIWLDQKGWYKGEKEMERQLMTREEFDEILTEHACWLNHDGGKQMVIHDAYIKDLEIKSESFDHVKFVDCYFDNVTFWDCLFRHSNIIECHFSKSVFRASKFDESSFNFCRFDVAFFERCDFYNSFLKCNIVSESKYDGCDFINTLIHTSYNRTTFESVTFKEIKFRSAYFDHCNFIGSRVSNVTIEASFTLVETNFPYIPMTCPEVGSFTGWKKVTGEDRGHLIVKLQIPEDAKRSSSTGRKCRCNKAIVLAIENFDGTPANVSEAYSLYDNDFVYRVGDVVSVPDFDNNRFSVCAPGIHFFMGRQEAIDY